MKNVVRVAAQLDHLLAHVELLQTYAAERLFVLIHRLTVVASGSSIIIGKLHEREEKS